MGLIHKDLSCFGHEVVQPKYCKKKYIVLSSQQNTVMSKCSLVDKLQLKETLKPIILNLQHFFK